jgi:hypothetical protein
MHPPIASEGSGDDDADAWGDHVRLARDVLAHGLRLGRVPPDLGETPALLALGGPGTCALRSMARMLRRSGGIRESLSDAPARDAALHIAWGFRTLFNVPEVMSLLRAPVDEEGASYWRRAAEEGVNGNLQAILDEYAHLLPDWLGLVDHDHATVAEQGHP